MAIIGNISPIFHYVFRDANGDPAINGTVETFKQSAQTTQKATYEDRDLTVALPNPIPLNAAGVAADATGTPKPIYLSDDESYYIVVKDSVGNTIQTVENWNADNAFTITPSITEVNLKNYIENPQYRILINDTTSYADSDLVSGSDVQIARENWFFRRDTANSTNTINYDSFAVGQTSVPYNPKYYLNFSCSGTGAETVKDVFQRIGDSSTFSNQELTFAVYAKSPLSNNIQLIIRQNFGTGGSAPVSTVVATYNLTTSWAQYQSTFIVPDVSGKTIGTDGFLEIGIRMPLNLISQAHLTNYQLNLGATLLDFDYTTSTKEEDEANADQLPTSTKDDFHKAITLGDDKKTSEWRLPVPAGASLPYWGLTLPNGWLWCDGATYDGYEDSIYNRLYDAISIRHGFGSDGVPSLAHNNFISYFINKNDTNITPAVDVNTGFTFATIENGGDKGFITDIYAPNVFNTVRITNKINGVVTATGAGDSGFTITQIQAGTVSLPEITDITTTSAAALAGKHFLISSTATNYYIWFTVDGVGTDPAIGGRTGIKIALLSTTIAQSVAGFISWSLYGCDHQFITFNAAGTLTAGDYFTFYNSANTYDFYYIVDGIGSYSGSNIGVPIRVSSGDSSSVVATKTLDIIRSIKFQVPAGGRFIRMRDRGAGNDPNASIRLAAGDRITTGDQVGTIQHQDIQPHTHPFVHPVLAGQSSTKVAGGGVDQYNFDSDTGINIGTETRPVNIYADYIIKY